MITKADLRTTAAMGNPTTSAYRSLLSLASMLLLAAGCPPAVGDDTGDTDTSSTTETTGPTETGTTGSNGDCAPLVQADVDQDVTLPAGCYIAENWLSIQSALTLEAGVTISFSEFSGLAISGSGMIVASGSASNPVVLNAIEPAAAGWLGVSLSAVSSTQNSLEYTEISGVNANEAAVSMFGGGKISITNSKIVDNQSTAIEISPDSQIELGKTTIQGNAEIGWVGLGSLATIAADNEFTGNSENVLLADGSSIDTDMTWRPLGVPVRLRDTYVEINADLVLEAGFELQIPQDGILDVTSEGTFNAVGTADSPVIVHGAKDELGYWVGISFSSKSSSNVLDYVLLENGGGDNWNGNSDSLSMIWMTEMAKLKVTHSTFRRSAWYVLAANQGADISGFAGNEIRDNTRALHLSGDAAGQVDSDNVFADNSDENVVRVGFSEALITNAGEWSALTVPYFVSVELEVENDLVIAAGAEIRVAQDVQITVYPEGSLDASGSADSSVRIVGDETISGYWAGINYASISSKNRLTYTTLSDAGSYEWYGGGDAKASIYVGGYYGDALVTLQNSTIANADGYGLIVDEDSSIDCSVTFDGVEKPSVLGPGSC